MRNLRYIFFIILCFWQLGRNSENFFLTAYAESSMRTSTACIEFIKSVEGFSSQPYYDYNQYTVGYGTKCPTEKYFEYKANGIPKKEAEALLMEYLSGIEETLQKKLISKYDLSLTQYQFDALVSFSFNIGTGWMTYNSTLRNAILQNADNDEMVYSFGLYCTAGGQYLPGLITRRLCEANIYLNGIYSKTVSDEYGYVYYDANGGTLTYRVQGFVCSDSPSPISDVARTGDVFLGWYTELTGGTKVTSLSHAVKGQTLFAHWKSLENAEEQDSVTTSVRVTGDGVNIRKGPGTNYGIVKHVYRNTILNVSHVTHLTTMKWGKVEDGWIALNYTNYDDVINGVEDSDPENSNTETTLSENNTTSQDSTSTGSDSIQDVIWGTVCVNDLLRIRSGPGTNYTVVGFLFNNKEVEIYEIKTVGSMDWGRISRGWVSMDYIQTVDNTTDAVPEPSPEQAPEQEISPEIKPENSESQTEFTEITGKIKADALRIRSGAGTENPIVGFYYENDMVTIVEKKSIGSVYWGKTNKGWINMDYVVIDSHREETPQSENGQIMTVIGDCLRVRKGTGTDYKISALLYYGDKITVFETLDVNGVLWGRVQNGWICMDYVA